jgi:hypothetical protein
LDGHIVVWIGGSQLRGYPETFFVLLQ